MKNEIYKDILVLINKEISKIDKKLTTRHHIADYLKEVNPLNPLIKEYEILNKKKNLLIIVKCLNKINKLNSKIILLFKRCEINLENLDKIEKQIIEQENIIKNII